MKLAVRGTGHKRAATAEGFFDAGHEYFVRNWIREKALPAESRGATLVYSSIQAIQSADGYMLVLPDRMRTILALGFYAHMWPVDRTISTCDGSVENVRQLDLPTELLTIVRNLESATAVGGLSGRDLTAVYDATLSKGGRGGTSISIGLGFGLEGRE